MNWEFVREGASHSLYQLGATRVVLPRHSEINEITALSIMKDSRTNSERGGGSDHRCCTDALHGTSTES